MVRMALSRRQYFFGKRARILYELIGWQFRNATALRFMNYGFATDEQAPKVDLHPDDEAERYCAQLYHALAAQVDLSGKLVLDVGSGRGGGTSYVHRYFGPSQTTGCDVTRSAIAFCQRAHSGTKGLNFLRADAMNLPFEANSFHTVINVESSHCYPNRSAFFVGVFKVLKPGGHFLYADFTKPGHNPADDIRQTLADLDSAGFHLRGQCDITSNILRGLDHDSERRQREIHARLPFGLRKMACLWAGVRGSWIYEDFVSRRREYVMYTLQKPGPALAEVERQIKKPVAPRQRTATAAMA